MNHSEAVQKMAVEQYLLDEMGPDARNEFEEHMFDCPECALDVRAGVVFIDEAKRQLPAMVPVRGSKVPAREPVMQAKRDWFAWLKPVYLAPAFAALLGVIGYQNLVTLPAMRASLETPRIDTLVPLHDQTRGAHQKVAIGGADWLPVPVDLLPVDGASYGSYVFELVNGQGKTMWNATIPAPGADEPAQRVLTIPGKILATGTYTVNVFGVDAQGQRKSVESYAFDLTVGK